MKIFLGQYGGPKFHAGLFCGFLVSAMASVFESVGDYHAIARISQERPPPSHAINRGIFTEAFGSFISGWLGPENIGVIGITRVASRTTLVVAGFWLILLGLFTKVGAILSTIPIPLVGGVLGSSMAMVSGVAIANVQSVDLKNSRNMGIIGFALVCGLVIPGKRIVGNNYNPLPFRLLQEASSRHGSQDSRSSSASHINSGNVCWSFYCLYFG